MYEAFFKLTGKPFRLTPDPRFFYNSRGHKRALAYLRYGIRQGEGFIVVTGDVGTGKSMLVSALFRSLARENIVGAQIVTTQMEADDLLRMVAASFGVPFEGIGKAELLRNLEGYFRSCVQEGKRVLLVVDEAQGLPRNAIEELRMLSNFTMDGRSVLQSFLLGQREFRTTMRSAGFEQLRQRVIAAYHLKPLDVEETRGYVEHRLQMVGWANDPHFHPETFVGMHNFTDGVPRRINTLADRLLLFAYLEELHEIDPEALAEVARDIVEEQGGVGDDSPLLSPGADIGIGGDRSDGGRGTGTDTERGASTEARLSAMENSMESLTDSVRQEISLLRQALLDKKSGSGEKD